ncbi:MAG: Asp-tRNA(Asn)/Glu-tRNA(Gln) amidotransferase subunit GatA [Clostridiales bacterium]|jgi:aspartyl-tRNA(Asn)/glutamyl-tRNA(Gln) amidotransferase subunit A|nr:Asp-tRNA(Asn)/Glu-tRNA(Gln) amidotransferase subunit GatA [Clostridiales bacterium]
MNISLLRKKLDGGELSATELTRLFLDRISLADGIVDAYLHVDYDGAIKMAETAQKLIDSGRSKPLTGIPIALKDNLSTRNMPTTCASKMLEGYVPPFDATVVERLRAEGAVFLGKLNLDEFAMGASTKTSYYKKTKNPYDLARVPGGSSGGSAAAVAAELCVAALGTDTGGSIRQPAAFCGVTGHRPTYGLVSRYGCVAFASSLDQIGPIAGNAEDCAAVLEAICGKDARDPTSAAAAFSAAALDTELKGKRIGIIKELTGAEVDKEVAAAVTAAAEWYERAGADVGEVSLPMLAHAVPIYYLISSAEASSNLAKFDGVRYGYRSDGVPNFYGMISKSRAEGFGWEVKRRIMLGSYALCSGYYDDYYKRAVRLCGVIRAQYKEAFAGYDMLLSPVAPTTAYPYDRLPDDPAQMYLADICTVSAALAGLPALSTPCGYDVNGMPIGLMITGGRFRDAEILGAARLFEKEFRRMPPSIPNAPEFPKI